MKTKPEKRTNNRNVIHQPVSFEMIERRGGRLRNFVIEGVGVDLSSEGVGVFTDYPLDKGEVLKLHYPVNVGNASLPVYTEVMWTQAVNTHFRAGLRFLA